MSRLHRAVEKAEREGLLRWTRPIDDRTPRAAPLEDQPPPPRVDRPGADAATHAADGAAWPALPVDGLGAGTAESPLSPLFVAVTAPASIAAEQYRLLRTRLEARDAVQRTQLLVVTSPRLGDGKTTTSANLALTMAKEYKHRVVLVEADVRRSSLSARFGLAPARGLIDVLVGAATLEDALIRLPGQNLTLLPAGAEAARSTELLVSSMMQRTLDALRAQFDRIVVDTPPVTLADTQVLARLADGVLIVVRAGVTPRPALERAIASVDRERLLGIVLNEVDDGAADYSCPGPVYARPEA